MVTAEKGAKVIKEMSVGRTEWSLAPEEHMIEYRKKVDLTKRLQLQLMLGRRPHPPPKEMPVGLHE
jgi:hypothetical protein